MSSDEKIPVAFFRHTLLPYSETFIATQAAHLRRYEAHFFGRERGGGAFNLPRVRLIQEASERRPLARGWYTLTGRSRRLLSELRRVRPALLHAHFAVDGLYALPYAETLGVPLVTSVYGYDATEDPRFFLSRAKISNIRYGLLRDRLRRGGDLFLAASEFLRERLVRSGFPAERTLRHYPGIETDRLTPAGRWEEGPTVVAVGRLVPFKGTEYLIRAAAILRADAPGLRVVLVGDGPLRPALERLVSGLGLEREVLFRGALSHEETLATMRGASVLCQPSVTVEYGYAEALGVTLLEAGAMGVPVVATRSGGMPEIVSDGESGFLVEERDARSLADRLARLLADGELRKRMGAAGRKIALERFDARSAGERLEGVYDALLRGEAPPAPSSRSPVP
jgi:glycosyltransferase involved in cell wall biosynthesis